MTELSDERASQAITILLVEDDAPTCWRLQDGLPHRFPDSNAAGA
jgi:hypothetical protein